MTAVITLTVAAIILGGIAATAAALRRGQDRLGRILAAHRLQEAMIRAGKDSSDENEGAALWPGRSSVTSPRPVPPRRPRRRLLCRSLPRPGRPRCRRSGGSTASTTPLRTHAAHPRSASAAARKGPFDGQ